MDTGVLWLLLTMAWVGLQCVIVVFPDQYHLLFVMGKVFLIYDTVQVELHHILFMLRDIWAKSTEEN